MLSREAYQCLAQNFNTVADVLQVSPEDTVHHANKRLQRCRRGADFINQLGVLSNCLGDVPQETEEKLAASTLAYAPLINPESSPHVLAGVAYAQRIYSRYLQPDYLERELRTGAHPLLSAIRAKLKINPKRALGLLTDETHFGTDDDPSDVLKWDLMTLAELVDRGGEEAPQTLRTHYGIEHFGRYPAWFLVNQHELPVRIPTTYHELPIYISMHDHNASFWQEMLYEQIYDFAAGGRIWYVPRVYEVNSMRELLERMAAAQRPAFGFISAHGNETGITLGPRSSLSNRREYASSLWKVVQKAWHESGGVALLSCEAGDTKFSDHPVGLALSEQLQLPVATSADFGESISLRRSTKLGKTTMAITFQPRPKSGRLFVPDAVGYQRRSFRLAVPAGTRNPARHTVSFGGFETGEKFF